MRWTLICTLERLPSPSPLARIRDGIAYNLGRQSVHACGLHQAGFCFINPSPVCSMGGYGSSAPDIMQLHSEHVIASCLTSRTVLRQGPVRALAVDVSGQHLVTAGADGQVCVVHIAQDSAFALSSPALLLVAVRSLHINQSQH